MRLIGKTRPAILIPLDLTLPDFCGLDILNQVKANPHTCRAMVIVLMATGMR